MREENRDMKRMVQRLLARSATDDQPVQLPEDISFPICTPEQMAAFDEVLEDQTKLSSVVSAYIVSHVCESFKVIL